MVLQRAANLGSELFVGVSSDALNFLKNRYSIYSQMEKIEIIKSLKYVTEVFLEESLEFKREYLPKYQADILVMGDDWEGKFDEFKDIVDVVYLPRTPSISTTELIEKIKI